MKESKINWESIILLCALFLVCTLLLMAMTVQYVLQHQPVCNETKMEEPILELGIRENATLILKNHTDNPNIVDIYVNIEDLYLKGVENDKRH